MKIIIAPTAFKGSLSPAQAAQAIAKGLQRSKLEATLHLLPLADGGDGTLESFLLSGGQRVEVDTVDALGRPISATYGRLDDQTAIIEMAQASGLAQLKQGELDALKASTYGTGVLLQAALEAGATRIIVGLGGSATTDGGMGALAALGARFVDADGRALQGSGVTLGEVATIDASGLDARWRGVELIIATDVENRVLGREGAAAVFAPQKGASPLQVSQLERGMSHFFALTTTQSGVDVRDVSGGGAAGGLAAGLLAYLGGRIESGVDLILDHHRVDAHLQGTSLVITGEGNIDSQTLGGKAPLGIARRAAACDVPTLALVGGIAPGVDEAALHDAGFWAVMPITPRPMRLQEALVDAPVLLERAALRVGYMLRLTIE